MSLSAIVADLKTKYPEKSKTELSKLVKDVYSSSRSIVNRKGRLNVPGFGVLTKKERAARVVKLPDSETRVEVPKQDTVRFTLSKGWKEELKQQ